MELAPFPFGRLPGFRRASPSTPLDAYCYVGASIASGIANAKQADGSDCGSTQLSVHDA